MQIYKYENSLFIHASLRVVLMIELIRFIENKYK